MIIEGLFARALIWSLLVLAYLGGEGEAKVRCHDCMDTEKGWCKDTTCVDEYCYKANVTFNGKRIIKLGCMPHGKLGCERRHVHFPAIADVAGDFCVCETELCNEALPAMADDGNYTLLDYYYGSAVISSNSNVWTLITTLIAAVLLCRLILTPDSE